MRAWLDRWWSGRGPHAESERWLVLDVESTGLDAQNDQMLAIAAMAVRVDWRARRIALQPGDSLAVNLRPTRVSDKANILVHGIGVGAQRQGLDPVLEVVEGFEPLHSAAPRPLDPLGTGGIKGKRASKKDKLRAAAAAATGALVP
jgi:DNA polymerase-3 subunit epsilon